MSTTLAPDDRDALLAELRRRTTKPGFHFLSADHLQRLNEAQSTSAPIVSLYMELTPEARLGTTWETTFKDLCERAVSDAGEQKKAVQAECDRIGEALANGLPRTGRGVAFFACEALGLFEQLGTAIALPNEVHVTDNPYVRPLARVRDENDRFVIALVSAHKSRFFFAQIGLVEEVYELEGQELFVTDFASKDQRQDMKADMKRAQARRSAHACNLIAQSLEARHVIHSATTDMEADFLDGLDQATRQRVAASFSCDINATSAEVSDAAGDVQREVEAREELETLGKVQELLSSRAVAGLDDTLDMLNQQRVMTLVVDDAETIPGGIDPTSGMLTTQTEGTYEATGGAVRAVNDLVELMLDKAMEQGATLELVRSKAAREALREHGPAAALLRF
ncbi:peptide chain release factor 1 [Rubrivirga sp. S365]|uniref:Peptide chain release factor 1 n=1 Tax=Rubrivirga litoralis TaxID=3075598 RepID=A0ABU3BPC2_9BACT|nr:MULTISPECIES: peptide chain release factor 1 [unclassified Rubrivirga]MDT0631140.1 peptide chain release factor 1 [Rubrivirga sp. F394]MDT7855347.1 peptide chain release factor 1 [Rubrivirga sp. S365]